MSLYAEAARAGERRLTTSRARRALGFPPRRRGAMLVLVALMVVILLVTAAFSVDVAFMQLTRSELRTATDAAARAGSEALSRLQSVPLARQAAKDAAAANLVAGAPLLLADGDIAFGNSETQGDGSYNFQAGVEPINAVEVNGRRTDSSLSGPVNLLFAGVLGPDYFEPTYLSRSVNLDRDICLVVDRSGSMRTGITTTATLFGMCDRPHPASRWAALDTAVRAFLDEIQLTLQEEQVGLVSYSSTYTDCQRRSAPEADILQPLTVSASAITSGMQNIASRGIEGWTNIAAGIDQGRLVLTDRSRVRPYARRTMVVLTDGLQNRGRPAVAAARDAATDDIVIHSITFSNEADRVRMREVAEVTGGKYYHAPDAAALERIFREIARTMPVVLTH